MRIAITGGSGFIGTRLAQELLACGHEIAILDRVRSPAFPDQSRIVDVRDSQALATALAGIQLVYHLAAEHRDDVRPLSLYDEVNVDGSRNLAKACEANGIAHIIFTSSVAVYGMNLADSPEETPAAPFNDYGRTKWEAEAVLREWAAGDGARRLAIVRPAAIFGEGNRGNVYNLVRQINAGHFVMVGSGRNRKSMGYVGNVAAFLAFLLEASPPGVSVFNFADKPDFAMTELVELTRRSVGRTSAPLRVPYWVGLCGGLAFDLVSLVARRPLPVSSVRVRKFCASTTINVGRLQGSGFVPPYTLVEGMQRFLAHEFSDGK